MNFYSVKKKNRSEYMIMMNPSTLCLQLLLGVNYCLIIHALLCLPA